MDTRFLAAGTPRRGPAPNPLPGVVANGKKAKGGKAVAKKRRKKSTKKKKCKVKRTPAKCRPRTTTPMLSSVYKAHVAKGNTGAAEKLLARAKKRKDYNVYKHLFQRTGNPGYGAVPRYYNAGEQPTAGTPQNLPAKLTGVVEAWPALLAVVASALLPRLVGLGLRDQGREMLMGYTKGERAQRVRKAQAWTSILTLIGTWIGTAVIPSYRNERGEQRFGTIAQMIEKYRVFILAGVTAMTGRDVLDATLTDDPSKDMSRLRYILALAPPKGATQSSLYEFVQLDGEGKVVPAGKNAGWLPKPLRKEEKKANSSTGASGKKGATQGVGNCIPCTTMVGDSEWDIFTEESMLQADNMEIPAAASSVVLGVGRLDNEYGRSQVVTRGGNLTLEL